MIALTPRMAVRCTCWLALAALLFPVSPPARAAGVRGAAAPTTPPGPLLVGVNISDVGPQPPRDADSTIREARALHANVVRIRVPWSVLQPTASRSLDARSLAFMD